MSPCPRCGNEETLYGASETQHWLRAVLGSPKRYCPNCKSKWRVRTRAVVGPKSMMSFIYFIFALVIGGWLFIMISDALERAPEKAAQSSGSSLNSYAMRQMKDQMQQNPGALAAIRSNPKLFAEAKEKYQSMQ